MKDERMEKLAHILVTYSCNAKPGERVLIEATGIPAEFVDCLVKEVYAAGAEPVVWIRDNKILRALLMNGTREKWEEEARLDCERMRSVQAYIGIRGGENSYELSDVPPEKMKLYGMYYAQPVHGRIRVPHTKWVVLRWPAPSMAQAARKSTEAFENHYFDVCTLDYARMNRAMEALKIRMESTDQVHILGKGTDLSFSIKGMPAIKCSGEANIPDGEIYTAPVKNSVNGVLQYNTPSLYQGTVFENMRLVFENGRIIEAASSDTARCNAIFDTDEGARYVGEFALGVNPYITSAIMDTLFDEKIAGSFHFTPGNSYDDCPNGNQSAVHWDLVCIQTPEYGGGEIWFDGELIRKDGRFVPQDLQCLNPENLME